MTHSGGLPHTNVGDRDQRYEISYLGGDGSRHVMGWSNHLEGVMAMTDCISKHPVWRAAQIRDRRDGMVIALGNVKDEE